MSDLQNIHATAIVHPSAIIDPSATIGPYCIVGENVSIGADTILHRHVVVSRFTKIGKNNKIYQFASIGEDCQDLKYDGEETWLEIGDNNCIREACSFHRGTVQDDGITRIGSNNLFMVNTHVAHDCKIGDNNIFANNVGVAGHVQVADFVIIGGNSGIHQFCKIDSYSMVGGASLILKDISAFSLVSGNPARVHGFNTEGMIRKGWSRETIRYLKEAYKIVFQSGLTAKVSIEKITEELLPLEPKTQLLIDSLTQSKRGIVR